MADWYVNLIPFASDNYAYLIETDDALAVVDPGEAAPINAAIKALGKPLKQIIITHHHGDHVGGVSELATSHAVEIFGPAVSQDKLETSLGVKYAQGLKHGDRFDCLGAELDCLATPGHTLDHMCYYSDGHDGLFSADCLFILGCGRLFEGDAAMMWESFLKLRDLPDETMVFCGHEYTLDNLRFAQSLSPKRAALVTHGKKLKGMRDEGYPTVPSTIGDETRFNPFMRCDDLEFVEELGMKNAPAAEVFAEVRKRKDNF